MRQQRENHALPRLAARALVVMLSCEAKVTPNAQADCCGTCMNVDFIRHEEDDKVND